MRNAKIRTLLGLLLALPLLAPNADAQGPGWTRLFDGQSLAGWTKVGGGQPGYVVKDGILVCPADGGYGDLYTEQEYSDFVFRFEFRCDKGGNNGVSIRSSMKGDGTYTAGQEIQILDDYDPMYANLEPGQYCCGVYKFIAPKRNVVHHAGEWNQEQITLIGRHIKIELNGQVVIDADFNQVTDPEVLHQHPALLRDRGHIGFLGHGPATVSFRNIWVKDLSRPEKDNVPPAGFSALFDGRTLKGWQALVADPPTRAKLTPDQLAKALVKNNAEAFKHWAAKDGFIAYDGKNSSLCTAKDYADFEVLVDWKIEPGGDGGVRLRGMPGVRLWDNPVGSGGLHNNLRSPNTPAERADNPAGEWNRFRILMVGDKVTVHLNGKLVVNAVPLENYWETDKPALPAGPIELEHHGSRLWFKNVYVREIGKKQ